MVLDRNKTPDGIDIVLWDFDYGTHFYSIMAYPIAEHTDYDNPFGVIRGKRLCLEIEFKNLEEAEQSFKELASGEKTILDFKDNIVNQNDIEYAFGDSKSKSVMIR